MKNQPAVENSVIKDGQIRPNYAKAVRLHSQIMASGTMAVQALTSMCKELKEMRDEQLYAELGYDSFENYVEQAVGIKKRQAYTYISTYERLGSTALQSNAQLGITKLALLADVPATERGDFADSNDLDAISAREMAAKVEELKKQLGQSGEQLSLLTRERNALKEDVEKEHNSALEAWQEKNAADEALKSAKERTDVPSPEQVEKIRKDVKAEAEKEIRERLKKAKERALAAAHKEAEERLEKAKQEARAAGAAEARSEMAAVEQEKAAAIARAEGLEKKLAIAGNKETILFSHLFEEFQENFNRALECVKKIEESDVETAAKLRGALGKCMDMLSEKLQGGGKCG